MRTGRSKKVQLVLILTGIAFIFSTGCNEGMKMKPVYNSAIIGGVIGAIIGHQSDRLGQGVAIGAGVGALGEFLHQMDMHPNPPRPRAQQTQARIRVEPPESNAAPRPPVRENIRETFVVQIHNDNGSVTPVEIRKQGDKYIGPTGEQYDKLPTEEELKPFYGL